MPKGQATVEEEILKMEKMVSLSLIFPGTWEMAAINQF